jgi:hypothetical protein
MVWYFMTDLAALDEMEAAMAAMEPRRAASTCGCAICRSRRSIAGSCCAWSSRSHNL